MTQNQIHDRKLLLLGPKRDAVLDLSEVRRYGNDSYGNADYVSIYGLRPADWYAKGIRLLGRTAVECTRDELADAIGKDIAVVSRGAPAKGSLVVDPFAGSGNTLYWILRHLPGARGVGLEGNAAVFQLTARNLHSLQLPVKILNAEYPAGLDEVSARAGQLLVAFVAPPWGTALDPTTGLDLRRTAPPITEIIDVLMLRFKPNPLLCAIQVYEKVNADSLGEVTARFDWSTVRMYNLNAPGQNHGILLATKGWRPDERAA